MQIPNLVNPITIPLAGAAAILCVPNKLRYLKEIIALLATGMTLAAAFSVSGRPSSFCAPWAGYGMDFGLRIYPLSAFLLVSSASISFLVALYSSAFMAGKDRAKTFFVFMLMSVGFVNGAVLSDNLAAMLFFWEGLLVTMFVMIYSGSRLAYRTAVKALVIAGVADLCLLAGIVMAGHVAGTLSMSVMSISIAGPGAVAFLLLVAGAIGKAGSMPFHSWIPDAAVDAPLPFMALVPAAAEKLVGIYFLARISMDIFKPAEAVWPGRLLMVAGAMTILFAVMMALVQKNYKRLLAYHAISQVGYMVLGIGTFTPAGIIGGLFHMLNNAMYKSCLFMTGGAVEKQAGTTDLEKLGGLGRKMPFTFACFIMTALAISGVPPLNGFFSKELIYEAALEKSAIFYIAAVAGSFLTAASFLKLGHSAFLGAEAEVAARVKEAPAGMLAPMGAIAAGCLALGIWNRFPIDRLIAPAVVPDAGASHIFGGFPANHMLTLITLAVLGAACANHIYGTKRTGSPLRAADHIHYAPALSWLYRKAEAGYFDPYNAGAVLIRIFSSAASFADRAINHIYDTIAPGLALAISGLARRMQTGDHKHYVIWSVAAAGAVIAFLLRSLKG